MATYKANSAIPLDKSSYFGAMETQGRGALSNMGALAAERERIKTQIENANRQKQAAIDASNAATQAQFSALGVKEASGGIYDWMTESSTPSALIDNASISGVRPITPITTQPSTIGGSTLPVTQPTLGTNTALTNTAVPIAETATSGVTLGTANTTGSALEAAGLYGEMANVGAGASVTPTATTATEGASLLSSGSAGTGAAFSSAGALAGGLGAAMGGYSLATSKKARKSPGTWLQTAGGVSMMIPGGQLLGGASMGIGAIMNAFGWEI